MLIDIYGKKIDIPFPRPSAAVNINCEKLALILARIKSGTAIGAIIFHFDTVSGISMLTIIIVIK